MAHLNVRIDMDVVGARPEEVAGVLEAFSERIREGDHPVLESGEWGTLVDGEVVAGRWWVIEE